MKKNISLYLLVLFFPLNLLAQANPDWFESKDLSKVFLSEHRDYTIGYIGVEKKRLFVRLKSVKKQGPKTYDVEGLSKVGNNKVPFSGTLTLETAEQEPDVDMLNDMDGTLFQKKYQGAFTLMGNFQFSEAKGFPHIGIFKGEFKVSVLLHKDGSVSYNDLLDYADGFSNMQFSGHWSPYDKNSQRPVAWGDYRIEDAGDLDVGAGEFFPNPKYHDKGWGIWADYIEKDGIDPYYKGWWK